MSIFETTYYGNTLLAWAIAFGLMLLSLIVGRVLYWFFGRYIKKLTARTETELDDVLIDKLEEAIVALLVIFGTRSALFTLTFNENSEQTVRNLFAMAV
ncbi:MAG TPA: hypothetical protein ENJ56_07510, partial [Anaerolineae bacterium]|nr:hypothetical protein [Anaerolineae bacterium]